MIRKYRLLTYATLIVFAWFSQILDMDQWIMEPIYWTALVLVIGTGYEIYAWKAGKK